MHKTPQKAHVVGIGKPINLDIILISLANSAFFLEHVLVLLADLFWPISLSYAEAIYHRSLAPRRKQPERTTGLAAPSATFFPRLIEFVLEGAASLENLNPGIILGSHMAHTGAMEYLQPLQ